MRSLSFVLALTVACSGDDKSDTGPDADTSDPIPAGPVEVTLLAYDGRVQRDLPFVAFQQGDGPWQDITGQAGRYTMPETEGPYGLTWACVEGASTFVRLWSVRALTSELPALTVRCPATPRDHTVTGTVSNLRPANMGAVVRLGPVATSVTVASPSYTLSVVPGRHDAVISELDADQTARRLLVRRDLDLTTVPSVNFDMSAAVDTVPATLTVDDPTGSGALLARYASLYTEGGTGVYLGAGTDGLASAGLLSDGDVQEVTAYRIDDGGAVRREARAFIGDPGPVSLTLPEATDAPAVSGDADGARASVAVALEAKAGVRLYGLRAWTSPSASVFHSAFATEGWRAAQDSALLDTPDVAALPGWDAGWDLPVGEVLAWYYTETRSTGDIAQLLAATISQPTVVDTRGLTMQTSERSGQIQP